MELGINWNKGKSKNEDGYTKRNKMKSEMKNRRVFSSPDIFLS